MIPKHPFRNLVLPAVILAPLIGVMVGCVYIPTFDHTILDGTKKDFRGWAKDHKNIAPFKLAAIDRPQIERMFGNPPFVSENSQCVAYVMGTENDIWISPLCFQGGFVKGQTHVLKLVYDDHGRLQKVIPLATGHQTPAYTLGEPSDGHPGALSTLDDAAGFLRDVDATCPPNEVVKTWTLNSAP